MKVSPYQLLRSGNVAKIPFIIGGVKDEVTMLSVIAGLNLITDAEFQTYFKIYFFPMSKLRISPTCRQQIWLKVHLLIQVTFVSSVLQYKRLSAAIDD